jgi:hypothetical protein
VANTRDKLIPYFDLFDRLDDEQLSRVSGVPAHIVDEVRTVVESIYDPLREYEKLMETLDDGQLCKLFGFPRSAAAIWRHCRAAHTLKERERNAEGLLDEMMGEEDDLLIVVDEVEDDQDGIELPADLQGDDWSGL